MAEEIARGSLELRMPGHRRARAAALPGCDEAAAQGGGAGGKAIDGRSHGGSTGERGVAAQRSLPADRSKWKFSVVLGEPTDQLPDKGCCGRRGASEDKLEASIAMREMRRAAVPERERPPSFEKFVADTCAMLHGAGFQLGLAERTAQTKDHVILLLAMGEAELRTEYRRLQIERWQDTGAGVVFRELRESEPSLSGGARTSLRPPGSTIAEKIEPTEADRIQVFAEVLTHACGFGDLDHLHDRYGPAESKPDRRVLAIFPLHDRAWESSFMKRWAKEGGVVRSCSRIRQEFNTVGKELASETQGALLKSKSFTTGLVNEGAQSVREGLVHFRVAAEAVAATVSPISRRGQLSPLPSPNNEGGPAASGSVPANSDVRVDVDEPAADPSGDPPGNVRAGLKRSVFVSKEASGRLVKGGYGGVKKVAGGVAGVGIGVTKGSVNAGVKIAGTGLQSSVVVVKGIAGFVWRTQIFVHKMATAFWTRDDIFIDSLRENYGERVGIYFAFLNVYSNSLLPIAIVMLLYYFVSLFSWRVYLRGLGVLGLLIASVWGPLMIVAWRRRSNGLLFHWSMLDTKELAQENAYCDHSKAPADAGLSARPYRLIGLYFGLVPLVLVLIVLLFVANFALITIETQLMWAPVCGTYMDKVVTEAEDGWLPCMQSTSLEPWGGDRGVLFMLLGILTGLLIDVVYVELFNFLADVVVKSMHIRSRQDFEDMRVSLMFPFHWGGFMFYFLLLAAFVPFGVPITSWVERLLSLESSSGVEIANDSQFWDCANCSSPSDQYIPPEQRLAKRDYWTYWTYEKRFMLEMDTAMVGPLVVAVWLEFLLSQLMPYIEYVRTRYIVRHRGQAAAMRCCPRMLARLTCCCGGHHAPEILWDVIEDDHVPDRKRLDGKVQRGSYRGLAKRLSQRLGREVELVGGSWETHVGSQLAGAIVNSLEQVASLDLDNDGDTGELGSREQKQSAPEETSKSSRPAIMACEDAHVANTLLLESLLPPLELHFEYMQIAQQFAYCTVFSITWALAPIMNLIRCSLEAQSDAFRMFQYYRRPIPSKPATSKTIGQWEKALEVQVYLACVLTSFFFTFCTGELEAWADVWSSANYTESDLREGAWEGCVPMAASYTTSWQYGPKSQCATVTNESWDTVDAVEPFTKIMAPNLDCWNDQKINNTLELCEQPPDAKFAGVMGWDQIAKRSMVFLLINHMQFFLVFVAYHVWSPFPLDLKASINEHLREQKRLMSRVLFREEDKPLKDWHKLRGAVRAKMQLTKLTTRRIVTAESLQGAKPQRSGNIAKKSFMHSAKVAPMEPDGSVGSSEGAAASLPSVPQP